MTLTVDVLRTDERTILAQGEVMQTLCVAACVVFWGGCRVGGGEPPWLPVWGTFILAALQSMFVRNPRLLRCTRH